MEEMNVFNGIAVPPQADIAQDAQNESTPVNPAVHAAPTADIPPVRIMPQAAGIPQNTTVRPTPPSMPPAITSPLELDMPDVMQESAPSPLHAENMPAAPVMRVTPNMPEKEDCSYKQGQLPPCAPLAAGFVPFQLENPPKYSAADALTHGTLFPGLDLPFMNIANKSNPYAGTPLGEVMALDFACHELKLYLDTHKDDQEAFEMLKTLLALGAEGRKRYEKMHGPISIMDLERADKFTWIADPWPWEYSERRS